MSREKPIRGRRPIAEQILKLSGVAVAVAGTLIAVYFNFYEMQDRQLENRVRLEELSHTSEARLASIQDRLERIIRVEVSRHFTALDQLPHGGDPEVRAKLTSLETELQQLKDSYLGLRQAIDPLQPEEVLTIARLGDEVARLSEEIDELSNDLAGDQSAFQTAVRRELDASDKTLSVVLVVLIPLVLNLLYSFWQDRRKDQKQNQGERTANP